MSISGNRRRAAGWGAAVVLGLLAVGGRASAQAQPTQNTARANYDTAWWSTIEPREKFGFIKGVEECQILNAHTTVGIIAIEEVEVAAMDKYAEVYNPRQYPNYSMSKAWEDMTSTDRQPTRKELNHYLDDRNGYERWADFSEPGYHRGIVEGHIACRERHGPLRWSKPVEYYLDKLDRYYNLDLKHGPDQGQYSLSSQLTKLADPR